MKLRQPLSPPSKKVDAIISARDFLLRLTSPKEEPRIPREVRREAQTLLRHFPPAAELRPILEKEFKV